MLYHNAQDADVKEAHEKILGEIDRRGLLFPVTVIDGVPVYDGAVSYPGILRAVRTSLEEATSA